MDGMIILPRQDVNEGDIITYEGKALTVGERYTDGTKLKAMNPEYILKHPQGGYWLVNG